MLSVQSHVWAQTILKECWYPRGHILVLFRIRAAAAPMWLWADGSSYTDHNRCLPRQRSSLFQLTACFTTRSSSPLQMLWEQIIRLFSRLTMISLGRLLQFPFCFYVMGTEPKLANVLDTSRATMVGFLSSNDMARTPPIGAVLTRVKFWHFSSMIIV